MRNALIGLGAGLLSALVSVAVAYVVGVVIIAAELKEFLPTLLAATTVLPLMLFFTLLIPTIIIGLLVGLAISLAGNSGSRVYLVGAIAGLIFGVAILCGLLPLVFGNSAEDFISIISRPVVSAIYALFLGFITSVFYSWFSKPRSDNASTNT